MFGLEPDIDLSQIKDDMTNSDNGYSYVTDPKNNLTSAYLELLQRACTARHGCLSRGDRWNWSEVDRYRKKEEDFREILGLAMSLTGGQQPRCPELSSLLLYAVVVVFRRNTTNLARARCRVVRARVMSVYFVKLP
jgi:hypothetical protein